MLFNILLELKITSEVESSFAFITGFLSTKSKLIFEFFMTSKCKHLNHVLKATSQSKVFFH